jgi:hypothetical protein|tara:strand:+ start:2644 stop:2880 length:237 start_codon:yes stop_codon:yes gene_type:complete
MSAMREQVGGNHYKEMTIEPLEFVYQQYGYEGLKAAVHCKIEKYLGRSKESELEDLRKAAHCVELLIEFKMREEHKNL